VNLVTTLIEHHVIMKDLQSKNSTLMVAALCCFFLQCCVSVQRLLEYFQGYNEEGDKMMPTVPLSTLLLTADSRSESVKGAFYAALYVPDRYQVGLSRPSFSEVDAHLLVLLLRFCSADVRPAAVSWGSLVLVRH
jgi:hypothetical protein